MHTALRVTILLFKVIKCYHIIQKHDHTSLSTQFTRSDTIADVWEHIEKSFCVYKTQRMPDDDNDEDIEEEDGSDVEGDVGDMLEYEGEPDIYEEVMCIEQPGNAKCIETTCSIMKNSSSIAILSGLQLAQSDLQIIDAFFIKL